MAPVTHLIELSGHIEVEDLSLAIDFDRDERVDLEVSKVQVDVNRVQAGDEIDERLLDFTAVDVLQQTRLDCLAVGQFTANGNEELNGFGVDVADIDTSLVGEENEVAFANRVDANVEFRVGRVRQERLDDEFVEGAESLLDLESRNGVSAGA